MNSANSILLRVIRVKHKKRHCAECSKYPRIRQILVDIDIYEDFCDAKIPHYCGADSFALNGAFLGYGVNYSDLGTATADMVVDVLVNGADPASTPVRTLNNGIATVNIETAEAIGLDYSMFEDLCEKVIETRTAQEFSDAEETES